MLTKTFDPWMETVHLLTRESGNYRCSAFERKAPSHARLSDPRRTPAARHSHENAQVFVRERLTDVTIVVDWSDSTVCNYVCQIWRIGRAPERGRCAVSGGAISRGEAIYRPIPLRPSPSNADAMISATEVEAALKRNHDDGLGVDCHQLTRRARR
ncbi:protein of unknown function [Pararobbsia alpina]|uniref:DUF3331 domain-containing protein n=1 Tax=Pararobbsia alpina TaxID=621374 RepID=UPI0039A5851E